ncbi:hypothetical protein EI555_010488, partial [Monodon monoceros]
NRKTLERDESPIGPPSLLGPPIMTNGNPGDPKSALHRGPPGPNLGRAELQIWLIWSQLVEGLMLNFLFLDQAMEIPPGRLTQRVEKSSKPQELVMEVRFNHPVCRHFAKKVHCPYKD